MSNERELEAGVEWYENTDWGNEDYKDGVVRGFIAGAEWQWSQTQAELAALVWNDHNFKEEPTHDA